MSCYRHSEVTIYSNNAQPWFPRTSVWLTSSFLSHDRENNLSDIITLKKGRLEDINLDEEKVDAIVSEWMGYFLLFEGMLDTVIYARDHYLAPGGTLLPNRCTLSIVGSGDTSACHLCIDRFHRKGILRPDEKLILPFL